MSDEVQAGDDGTPYPDSLNSTEMVAAAEAGTGVFFTDPESGLQVFRYLSGGPAYRADTGQRVGEINPDAPVPLTTIAGVKSEDPEDDDMDAEEDGDASSLEGKIDPPAEETTGGEDKTSQDREPAAGGPVEAADPLLFENEKPLELKTDAGGEELMDLDQINIPGRITDQDLEAAGLEDGPGFTFAEALVGASAAAEAVAGDLEPDEELLAALYEFGHAKGWPGAETFYRQACHLMNYPETPMCEVPEATLVWFLVFSATGRALDAHACESRAAYGIALAQLERDMGALALKRKLADRRAARAARKADRPKKLKRAARQWSKLKAAQEKKAAARHSVPTG